MFRRILATALGLMLFDAAPATAVPRQIDFTAGPLVFAPPTFTPFFGLSLGDTVTGSFQFDDAGLAASALQPLQPALTSMSVITGTRSWLPSEVANNATTQILLDGLTQIIFFRIDFSAPDGAFTVSSNNTAGASGTTSDEYIFCNDCVTFREVDIPAIPLPAGLPLILAALGSLALLERRRRAHS